MSEAVLADAQFSVARVIKPDPSFLKNYEGQPYTKPICFPGNLDTQAGKNGYAPNLLAGIPVPFGSKILLWIPSIQVPGGTYPEYRYQILFRLRNLQDFQGSRKAYHFPKQSPGVNGDYVIPAAKRVIYYEGSKTQKSETGSDTNAFRSVTSAAFEALSFQTNVESAPFTPAGGTAAIQQGVNSTPGQATFNPIQFDCEGDEMLIFVTKTAINPLGGWRFTVGGPNGDSSFAETYGPTFPDLGIYLFTGSNP